MTGWERLMRIAAENYQVVTVRHAEGCGIGRHTLSRYARQRGWRRLHQGVYALPGAPLDYSRSVMAATLAYGPPVFASGRTAANLWRLTDTRAIPVQLIAPAWRGPTRRQGLVVTRTGLLTAADCRRLRRIPVTAVDRTLCDFAGEAGVPELREVVALAVQMRYLVLRDVTACQLRLGPHPGAAKLRAVVNELLVDFGHSGRIDSKTERLARRWLREGGMHPSPGVYRLVEDGRVLAELDIAFPSVRVFVEVDGYWWHSRPGSLQADHVRANQIVARDWAPIRTSRKELHEHPERFVRQARRVLASRGYRFDEAA